MKPSSCVLLSIFLFIFQHRICVEPSKRDQFFVVGFTAVAEFVLRTDDAFLCKVTSGSTFDR